VHQPGTPQHFAARRCRPGARPNLQAYRTDPDWPLVAALEIYDPETDSAVKAPVFSQRVVRPVVEVTEVDDVLDALLVCLDRHARVDLEVIAELWGCRAPAEAETALAGRIYRDPQSGRWETADAYLSGQVRAKLVAARAAAAVDARFLANVDALEAVQPADLEPSQIDCALGASWVPTEVVAHFLRQLLGKVARDATIDVLHYPRDALWRVTAPKQVHESIEATRTWGTERADAIELLEDALNQRETRVYDYPERDGKKVRVLNVTDTVDAQEKQAAIAGAFEAWIWNDGARARSLLSIYNTRFNGTRLQTFDGSHLRFPGASQAVVLDPHQLNAIWRILTTGNTLIAHCVGAGKTYLAVAAGMKLRQVGLARKVLHVTMNHMLEQYSRELLQLYPGARVLVAGTEDLSGDGRRLFLARVAEGDYDAIVITHGALGKLPMSRQFQEDFLRAEVESYRSLIASCDAEDRVTVKELTASLKQMEARLSALIARQHKDEILTFEELGVDAVFIDEIHKFKNLDTPTKIVGIPRANRPSQRATDLLMKAMYLDRIRPGRGFVGLSGTPISNTIAEMHVMARLHAPHLLTARGIDHFDGFAGTFIKRVNTPELAPDGRTYRVRTRFHFTNVAELTLMFRTFADVQMMRSYYEAPDGESFEGGTLELPVPKLAGGKPEVIAAKATDALRTFVESLVLRAEAIRAGRVKPWEDNMLAVVGDGRKAALDMRLIDPRAADWEGSKVQLCAANVHRTWCQTAAGRFTQLVFTDLSRPRSDGYSVCNALRSALIRRGIPAPEIAFAQDATTDARKAMLFKSVRDGRVRVLIGSTETMGMGTNVQDRLIRIHHLDAPWRPSDIEQRDGRMMRRGNRNPVCWITRYVTEESFDAYVWNLLHYKLTMINRIMLGDLSIRRVSEGDAAELSYAQMRAIASGNPLVLEKAAVDQRVLVLSRARRAFDDAQIRSRIDRVEIPLRIASNQEKEAALLADLGARRDTHAELFNIELAVPGDPAQPCTRITRRPEAASRLRELLAAFVQCRDVSATIGYFAGFALTVRRTWGAEVEIAVRGSLSYSSSVDLDKTSPTGNLQVVENLPRRIEVVLDSTRQKIVYLKQQLETSRPSRPNFPGSWNIGGCCSDSWKLNLRSNRTPGNRPFCEPPQPRRTQHPRSRRRRKFSNTPARSLRAQPAIRPPRHRVRPPVSPRTWRPPFQSSRARPPEAASHRGPPSGSVESKWERRARITVHWRQGTCARKLPGVINSLAYEAYGRAQGARWGIMTPADSRASLEVLRNAVRQAVERDGLRPTARGIGMTAPGLQKFLDGSAPRGSTLLKVRHWYVAAFKPGGTTPEGARLALDMVLDAIPASSRAEAVRDVAAALVRVHRAAGVGPPAWVDALLAE
jgi:N12 class adenine-specific DNA methylase/CheY-like chemotaxis protein